MNGLNYPYQWNEPQGAVRNIGMGLSNIAGLVGGPEAGERWRQRVMQNYDPSSSYANPNYDPNQPVGLLQRLQQGMQQGQGQGQGQGQQVHQGQGPQMMQGGMNPQMLQQMLQQRQMMQQRQHAPAPAPMQQPGQFMPQQMQMGQQMGQPYQGGGRGVGLLQRGYQNPFQQRRQQWGS